MNIFTLHLAIDQSISLSLLSAGFPHNIYLIERSPKVDIVATILNSVQQPCCIFVTSFLPRDFVQIASNKPVNYHSGIWLFLSHYEIILSQTCSNLQIDSTGDSENRWKQIFLTLWRMLLLANFELDGMMSHKHDLAAKTVSKWRPPKSPPLRSEEILQDSRHFRGPNFGGWKSKVFICY